MESDLTNFVKTNRRELGESRLASALMHGDIKTPNWLVVRVHADHLVVWDRRAGKKAGYWTIARNAWNPWGKSTLA